MIYSGHVEATIRLLDEGAELSAGEGASSPLHWAVDSNSVNIVKRLIEYDCDVNHVDETTTVSFYILYIIKCPKK